LPFEGSLQGPSRKEEQLERKAHEGAAAVAAAAERER